jgi:hypothetical protein
MELTVLIISSAITLVTGSVATLLLTKWFEKRESKRDLFANAYKTILAWEEMLNRVRRRSNNTTDVIEITKEFHDLQEKLNYYQGIISVQSKWLGKSYSNLVRAIKSVNAELINEAWKNKPVKPTDSTKTHKHPDSKVDKEKFLQDTRSWLSLLCFRKIAVWWRNK